jgi:hypothetical protein
MATRNRPPSPSAVTEPIPTAPADNLLAPLYTAWATLRPQLDAATTTTDNIGESLNAIGRWLTQEVEVIKPRIDAICKRLSADEATQVRADLAFVERGALAAHFIDGQLGVFRAAKRASKKISAAPVYTEAVELQRDGHAYLPLLTMAGGCEADEAALIVKGRGAKDTAQDCQRMGLLYDKGWHLIEPLLGRITIKDAAPLTAARVKRMREVGDQLAQVLRMEATQFKDTTGVDWSHHRAALLPLLHTAWEPLRHAALLDAARTNTPAPRLVPLSSMRANSALYR